MSNNDQSRNHDSQNKEENSENETSNVLKIKPQNLGIFSSGALTSGKSGSVKTAVSEILQKHTNYNDYDDDKQGPSIRNTEVRIIHPQQFKTIKSSEDLLLSIQSSPSIGNSGAQSSSFSRPGAKMSNNGFKNFLQTNFPSNLTIQTDNSLLWTTTVLNRDALRPYKPLVDKCTQSDVKDISRTIEENSLNEIFSRHTSIPQQIEISPSVIPPHPIQGDPPLEGAPPTYSAIMRIGTFNPRRMFGRRLGPQLEPSPPFISRSPPPTYAEAQGRFYRPVVIESDLLFGPDPMPAACQRCGTYVISTITSERSNLTHFAALGLCLCGCWPCCMLPYCMNSCKNTYHYCPNCNTFLGMYRPW